MAYNVNQARKHFSRLLKEAESGKDVVVLRGKKPVAKIVAINGSQRDNQAPFRLLGAYRGKLSWDDDAFDPMSDDELRACGFGYMLDAPLAMPPQK